MSEPWHRQSGESHQAFEAFCAYLELPPDARSLAAVGKQSGKSAALMERWSARWQWVERVASWTVHEAELRRAAEERVMGADAERWALERKAYRDTALELGKKLIERAQQMMTFPLAATTRTVEADGITQHITVEPARWRQADVAQFVSTADKLVRLALDLDTERVNVSGDGVREMVKRMAALGGLTPDEEEQAILETERLLQDGHARR